MTTRAKCLMLKGAIVVAGCGGAFVPAHAELFGLTRGPDYRLCAINQYTGRATPVFSFSIPSIPGGRIIGSITYDPSADKFVGVAEVHTGSLIIEIDLKTKSATVVAHGIPLLICEGVEYSPSLGGLVVSCGSGPTNRFALIQSSLYSLITLSSTVGIADADVIVLDSFGEVNVIDVTDPTNGFQRTSVANPFGLPTLTGVGTNFFSNQSGDLAYNPSDGNLYIAQDNHLSILNSGNTGFIDVGAFDQDGLGLTIYGLAWKSPQVAGNAYLDGYIASVVGELLEVEVWQNGSLVEILDGNYGPNGTFAFSPTVSGAAVLKFRFRTGLWKAVPVTLGPTPIENLTVNMTNGDCDHDNEVGIGDYAILSAIYGLSVGDPGYDTNADLNGDTTVDIADYAILSGSYGEIGE